MMRDNTSLGYPEVYDTTLTAWKALGGILFTHHFEDATRNISVSTGSTDLVVISFDITKRYAGSTLVIVGRTPISGSYSYQTGEYMTIAGTRKYEAAHFVGAIDDDTDGRYGTIFWQSIFTGIGSGSRTIGLGYAPRNGSSSEAPGRSWNPTNLSGRTRDRTTVITVYEVDPASIASIT
jgi:hypothetical protein